MLVGTIKDGIGSSRLEPGDKVHPAIRAADCSIVYFKVITATNPNWQMQTFQSTIDRFFVIQVILVPYRLVTNQYSQRCKGHFSNGVINKYFKRL